MSNTSFINVHVHSGDTSSIDTTEDIESSINESTPILRTRPEDRVWRLTRSLSLASHDHDSRNVSEFQREGVARASRRTLGTFPGVFSPVALSMFSTVLFLRGGFIVGQAGLLETIAQFCLAYLILLLTELSICAISTNGAVEGGGAYYMISRALGPEFGGSIGFLFFIANAVSAALYISGFVEAIVENFGPGGSMIAEGAQGLPGGTVWWTYLYASIVASVCLFVCIIGGAMFARTSVFILMIVIVSTVSVIISIFVVDPFNVPIPSSNKYVYPPGNSSGDAGNVSVVYGRFTGLSAQTFRKNLYENYTIDYTSSETMNFVSVFAILFSSVTGIMNGANMSGELKDPSRSIPSGTMSATLFTFITYLVISILVGGSCDRFLLVNDYVFLQQINLWGPLVLIGIFAATLSAALGNMIGASRILEALANDGLFWFFLKPATITTKGGNPYVAVLVSWVLVQLVLLVGSLNAIAPITSVFFLLSYAATNLACLALELASAPNFRPTFKYFTWHTAVLGLIGCIIMCFLISALYTSAAIIILLVLVILLHFQSLSLSWGSISQALIFHQVRKYLLMLDSRKEHIKYWRPQILLMVSNPRHCCELLQFVNDLKKGGLYVIGNVQVGRFQDFEQDPPMEHYSKWLALIDHLKIKAFIELTLATSVADGLRHLIRISGLGGMKPNTVCLGFYDKSTPLDTLWKTKTRKRTFFNTDDEDNFQQVEDYFPSIREDGGERNLSAVDYVELIHDALKLQKNVFLCRHFNQLDKKSIVSGPHNMFIDVWPVNLFRPETANFFDNACLFMLQLSCILNMVDGWKSRTTLRIFLCVNAESDNTLEKERKLNMLLRQLRIKAKIQLVSWEYIISNIPEADLDLDGSKMQKYSILSDDILDSIHTLLLKHSTQTAVTFLYLPTPPSERSSYTRYLDQLDILTTGLPPTVFVHGLHPVTSTTL